MTLTDDVAAPSLAERLRNPDIPPAISIEIEECHHRNIPVGYWCKEAADRIEELELCILMARDKFHADNSDEKAAVEMLRILNDVEILRLHGGLWPI